MTICSLLWLAAVLVAFCAVIGTRIGARADRDGDETQMSGDWMRKR